MVDIFVRIWAGNRLRLGLAIAVVERLRSEPGTRLTLLIAEPSQRAQDWGRHEAVVQVDPSDFHRRSKAAAEELAQDEVYVVIDDDHLPCVQDWLGAGLEAVRERSAYGYVASWSVNDELPSVGEDPLVFPGLAGTPYFIRKGILGTLPDGPLESYDTTFAEHVRARGWQTGFARRARHNHLGMGFSQVIPGHWTMPS